MDATLTGKDAAEAISLYMRLGAADARFDARRVGEAVRSRVGRARVSAGLVLARLVRPGRLTGRPRRRRSVARPLRLAAAAASPGRPAPRGEA